MKLFELSMIFVHFQGVKKVASYATLFTTQEIEKRSAS